MAPGPRRSWATRSRCRYVRSRARRSRCAPRRAPARRRLWCGPERGISRPTPEAASLWGATGEECGFVRTVTAGGVFALLEGARRAFPCIEDMEIEAVWTGFRPTSDDDAPILGATGIRRVGRATGTQRN